ncbi:MAG: lipoyl synthase, partial [Eubacteriales bacterium]
NIGECFGRHTATFMIMGANCTRNCRYCKVDKGTPTPLDANEPKNLAHAAKALGLKHTVVTSVTRDDLPDGGAEHFAKTILALKSALPESTVEVLIPDFKGDNTALKTVLDAKPDILNHNTETVPSLYSQVRPMAVYARSIQLLKRSKEIDPAIHTKSGLMVGLGETKEEVLSVMRDLRDVDCDLLTIGQYLRPSPKHLDVAEFITPEQFEAYKAEGLAMGFRYVASGPFVRSSYHAAEAITALQD